MSFFQQSVRFPWDHKAKLDALARKIGAKSWNPRTRRWEYNRSMVLRWLVNKEPV